MAMPKSMIFWNGVCFLERRAQSFRILEPAGSDASAPDRFRERFRGPHLVQAALHPLQHGGVGARQVVRLTRIAREIEQTCLSLDRAPEQLSRTVADRKLAFVLADDESALFAQEIHTVRLLAHRQAQQIENGREDVHGRDRALPSRACARSRS